MSRFERLELKDSVTVPGAPPPWEDPGVIDAGTWLDRAREAFVNERYEPALSAYSRVLQDDATVVEAWVGQVRCLAELGEYPEAVTWADRALERVPDNGDLLAARAQALARGGRGRDALESIDGAFRTPGISPFAWVVRGEVMLGANAENARRCFLKALEASPNDADLRLRIALAYLKHGDWFAALEHVQEAAEREPKRAALWMRTGECRARLGQYEAARVMYSRALSLDPQMTSARNAMAELTSRGVFRRALAGLRGLLRRR